MSDAEFFRFFRHYQREPRKPEQAMRIWSLRERGLSCRRIGAELGITKQAVHEVLKRLRGREAAS